MNTTISYLLTYLLTYVHCHAHRLNLALVDAVKSVQAAAEFFVLMEKLYVFMTGSYVHSRWIEIQVHLYKDTRSKELQKLSDTRWACRYAACKAVADHFEAVVSVLSELASGTNAHHAVEAQSLLLATDAKFVILLHIMCDILGKTQSLSKNSAGA